MKKIPGLLIGLMLVLSLQVVAQTTNDAKMKTFIDALMKKMTVEEKLGQLNLPGSGDIVTGQAGNSDIAKKIEQGKVGGLFNIKSFLGVLSALYRQSRKRLSPNPTLSVAFKKRAGMIWSVSTFSWFRGTAVELMLFIALLIGSLFINTLLHPPPPR